jgi:hypothetical protein
MKLSGKFCELYIIKHSLKMDAHEVGIVKETLLEALSNDNDVRKGAEKKLKELKESSMDKYCLYMVESIKDTDLTNESRVLAAVLLRGHLAPSDPTVKPMWQLISGETQEYMKKEVLDLFEKENTTTILHKIGELAAEMASNINFVVNADIWPELFDVCKIMIGKGNDNQVEAALKVYAESFSNMANEMVEHDSDLVKLFEHTLKNSNLKI